MKSEEILVQIDEQVMQDAIWALLSTTESDMGLYFDLEGQLALFSPAGYVNGHCLLLTAKRVRDFADAMGEDAILPLLVTPLLITTQMAKVQTRG